jgi:hypothetical protein
MAEEKRWYEVHYRLPVNGVLIVPATGEDDAWLRAIRVFHDPRHRSELLKETIDWNLSGGPTEVLAIYIMDPKDVPPEIHEKLEKRYRRWYLAEEGEY